MEVKSKLCIDQRTLDALELPLSISVAHRIDLVSDLFRTFLEGTKPIFMRYQEAVTRDRVCGLS
jgi:hypothetical protein